MVTGGRMYIAVSMYVLYSLEDYVEDYVSAPVVRQKLGEKKENQFLLGEIYEADMFYVDGWWVEIVD